MTWVVLAHAFIPVLLTTFPDKIINLQTATIVVTFSFAVAKDLSEAGFPHTDVKTHHGSKTHSSKSS